MTLLNPGGIASFFRHTFETPSPPRELPSACLLCHAFLMADANNVQDYRSQILSTFGTVLKMNSTKKVVKKLSGEAAEWFTSIANEYSKIVLFVLTCEESTECLEPMCRGVMDRFQQANQPRHSRGLVTAHRLLATLHSQSTCRTVPGSPHPGCGQIGFAAMPRECIKALTGRISWAAIHDRSLCLF